MRKFARIALFLVALWLFAGLLGLFFGISIGVIVAFAVVSLVGSYLLSQQPHIDRDVADRVYYAMMTLSVAALFVYQAPQKEKVRIELQISENNRQQAVLDGDLALLTVIEDDSQAVVSNLQKNLQDAHERALASPELMAGRACADAFGFKIDPDPPRSRLDQPGSDALERAISAQACEDLVKWARELRQKPPPKITDLKDIPRHRDTLRGVGVTVAGNTLPFDRLNGLLFAGGDVLDFSARRSAVGAEREKLVVSTGELAERQRSLGSLSLAGVLPFAVFVELVWPFVLISMLALKWARSTVRG